MTTNDNDDKRGRGGWGKKLCRKFDDVTYERPLTIIYESFIIQQSTLRLLA